MPRWSAYTAERTSCDYTRLGHVHAHTGGADPGNQHTGPGGTATTPALDPWPALDACGGRHVAGGPQAHDYPAAASYVSLLSGPAQIRALVSALKAAPVVHYKAKDILRAAGLALLPADDIHVAKDLAQIRAGNPLSPCLMIRGNARKGREALIADGYHRVCASYYTDEDTDIPVKIVKL